MALTTQEKVFAIFESFIKKSTYPSNRAMADKLSVSDETVRKCMIQLVKEHKLACKKINNRRQYALK